MRRILKIVVVLLLVVILGIIAVPFIVPVETLKGVVLTKLEAITGRKVSMGKITLSVFPTIALEAADVKVGNPQWAGTGDMADIKTLRLGVELIPLLHKQIHIKRFALEEPVIALIKNGDKANWQFGEAVPAAATETTRANAHKESAGSASQAMDIAIPSHIAIEGGKLTYQDAETGAVQDISDVNFDFNASDPEDKATLSAAATINGQKLDLKFTLGTLLTLTQGTKSDANLNLAFGPLILSWQGTIAFKGEKPNLTGSVNIPQIDVAAFSSASNTSATNASSGSGQDAAPAQPKSGRWSDAPINLQGLGNANANLNVTIGELLLQKTTLKDIAVKIHLAKAALVVSTNEIGAYGGTVRVAFGVNSANEASFAGAVANVKAGPLLRDFAGYDKLSGTLEGQVALTTGGGSEREMISNLTGKGDFGMKNGVWQGRSIFAMARNIGAAFGQQTNDNTAFAECSGTFTVKDGVVANNDLTLDSSQLRVGGQGTVDLPDWRVNYLLNPKLVADQEDSSGITVPIRIEGSLDNPHYRPDLQAALKENLKNPAGVTNTIKKLKNNLLNGNLGGLFR